MGNAEIYEAARQRIIELVTNGDPDAAVAACPGWTVKDVVAHLAGGLGDFTARRFDGVESGAWGERQVHERREWSLEDCLAEWAANLATAREALDSPMGGVLVTEIVSHEHDIRMALNRAGARDSDAVRAALARPLAELDRRIRDAGLPALRLVVDGSETLVGEGEPAGTLRASPFELLRSMGRRSRNQVLALDWLGDPDTWLDVFFLFGPPADDLHE